MGRVPGRNWGRAGTGTLPTGIGEGDWARGVGWEVRWTTRGRIGTDIEILPATAAVVGDCSGAERSSAAAGTVAPVAAAAGTADPGTVPFLPASRNAAEPGWGVFCRPRRTCSRSCLRSCYRRGCRRPFEGGRSQGEMARWRRSRGTEGGERESVEIGSTRRDCGTGEMMGRVGDEGVDGRHLSRRTSHRPSSERSSLRRRVPVRFVPSSNPRWSSPRVTIWRGSSENCSSSRMWATAWGRSEKPLKIYRQNDISPIPVHESTNLTLTKLSTYSLFPSSSDTPLRLFHASLHPQSRQRVPFGRVNRSLTTWPSPTRRASQVATS